MNTRQHIIEVAQTMIDEDGLINLSLKSLCLRVNIPPGSFMHIMDCTFTQFVRKMKKNNRSNSLHTVNKSRVEPSLRRDQLLNVAIEVAIETGYNNLTRDAIAKQAGVSVGLISNYFGTIKQLKRAIMRAAVRRSIPEIIAQGLVNKDVHALKAPQDLKTQAATLIANY